MHRTALAAVIVSSMMLCGCMGKSINAVSSKEFSKTVLECGYCAEDGISVTDSEDGTSTKVLADNGWLAGFYECADYDIAENEFYSECNAADMDDIKDIDNNVQSAEKTSGNNYSLYIRVGKTCLMMTGPTERSDEMKDLAAKLGYSDGKKK